MSDLILYKQGTPLPEPFQTWAQLRREQCTKEGQTQFNTLIEAFDWLETPEGYSFWCYLSMGKPMEPHPSWEPQEPLTMEDIFVGLK